MQEDFSTLQAGDQVYIEGSRSMSLAQVSRVTSTQIVIGEARYRKSDGERMGNDSYRTNRLRLATSELRDRLDKDAKKDALTRQVREQLEWLCKQKVAWLSIEQLQATTESLAALKEIIEHA